MWPVSHEGRAPPMAVRGLSVGFGTVPARGGRSAGPRGAGPIPSAHGPGAVPACLRRVAGCGGLRGACFCTQPPAALAVVAVAAVAGIAVLQLG
ncbi:hypothetical protein ACQCSX_16850 [Pseudarthrobacter sp. P1]|uniref:hypothetical protein n=1 Tax=Pseudarthrobacter sp. P1 TaxID=3418418 RepID=UPI003CEF4701